MTSVSSFLPLITTKTLESSTNSKRSSPKLSNRKETVRQCRSLSPRLSPKQPSSRSGRTPSPQRRNVKSPEKIGAPSPTRLEARDQSREQTRDINVRTETNSPKNIPSNESTKEESSSGKRSLEQSTSEECTMDESTWLKSSPVKDSLTEKNTGEPIHSEQSISENNTLVRALNLPEHMGMDVPLSTCEDNGSGTTCLKIVNANSGSLERGSLETVKSGSSTLEMTASTSSASSWENEQSHHILGGKKRRRTGARASGKGKRKKSKIAINKTDDNKELRNKK